MGFLEGKEDSTNKSMEDYKQQFLNYEKNITKDEIVIKLNVLMKTFNDLPKEQQDYFLSNHLYKCILSILRSICFNEKRTVLYIKFIKRSIPYIILMIKERKKLSFYMDVFRYIFDIDSKFYSSRIDDSYVKNVNINVPYAYVQRPRFTQINKSIIYIILINTWSKYNGFNMMMNQMEDDECDISILSCYIGVIRNLQLSSYLIDERFNYIMDRIWNNVIPKIRNVSIDSLKQAKKDEIETLITDLTKLFIVYDKIESDEANKITENLALIISSKCLKTGSLEKRLFAISHATSLIQYVETSNNEQKSSHSLSKSFLLDWIKKNQIIENIFGESKHIQLVKNASRIVKFITSNDHLDDDSLYLIWTCATTTHESLSKDTFSLLSSVSPYFKKNHVDFILNELNNIPYDQYTLTMVYFVSEMSQKCYDFNQRIQFVEILFNMISNDNMPWDLINTAYSCFSSIINEPFFKIYRDNYLTKMINSLSNEYDNHSKIYFFYLIKNLLQSIPKNKDPMNNLWKNLYETMNYLQEKYNFHHFLLEEFKHFKERCIELSKTILTDDLDDYLNTYSFPFSHYYIDEIKCRLELLYHVIIKSGIKIDQKQFVSDLWNILYNQALCSAERDECILWIYYAKFNPDEEYSSLGYEVIPYLFENHISKMDVKTMNKNGFSCFSKYFCESNVYLKRMEWANRENHVFNTLQPGDLLGEDELWNICLTCPNHDVTTKSMELLYHCYENDESPDEYRRCYIEKCMHYLSLKDVDPLIKERSLKSILKMLDRLEAPSSNYPTITRGTPIVIHVTLEYIHESESMVHKFDYFTHSREIIKNAYDGIINQCDKFLMSINLQLDHITSNIPYDTNDMTNTLEYYGIHSHFNLILKRTSDKSKRETNLRLRNAYKMRKSPPPNANELINNIKDITGLSIELSEAALKKWGWNLDRVLSELLDDFRREKFISEFKDKERSSKPYSEHKDTYLIMENRLNDLFSRDNIAYSSIASMISNNKEFMNYLFDVLKIDCENIVQQAWNIISRIPIPQTMKDSLVFKQDNPEWDVLLPDDTFKLLYTLKVIDQILFPLNPSNHQDKIQSWKDWFIETDGIKRLINIMLRDDIFDNLSSPFKLNVILLSLKLTYHFIHEYHDKISLDHEHLDHLKQLIISILLCSPNGKNNGELCYYVWQMLGEIIKLTNSCKDSIFTLINNFESVLSQCLLLTDDINVRIETSRQLYDHIFRLDQKTMIDLFNFLIQRLPNEETYENIHKYESYYWLVEKVIEYALVNDENDSLKSTFNDITMKLESTILNRDIIETSINSPIDWVLCGSLNILATIYKYWKCDLNKIEIIEPLYQFLFQVGKINNKRHPKCKTNESRDACYRLLIQVANLSHFNYESLLRLISGHHLGIYNKMTSWNFDPRDEDKSETNYVGIMNLGATCYMSSLLQQFFMMPNLRKDIFDCKVEENIDPSENIILQLQKVFGFLQETEKMSYNPKEFCSSYRDIEGNPIQLNQQQDVNEFFNILCLRIENQVRGTPNDHILHRHFVGLLSNEIRSEDPNYQYSSEREEEFYTIPLDIGHRSSFESALDFFIKSDKLEGDNQYYCEEFGTKINASRRCVLKKLPQTLIFHLMRFDYDLATNRKKKLNNYFQFPMHLNMKPWTKEGLMEIETGETVKDEDRLNESYDYELCGILIHAGDADSGHYYSIIKERHYPYRWLQFNDRIVTEFNPENIGHESFGGSYETTVYDTKLGRKVKKEVIIDRNAYMLFYERVDPNRKEEDIQQNPEIPKDVYDAVWADNSVFLRDRHLFDQRYFQFVLELAKLRKFEPVLSIKDNEPCLDSDGFDENDITLSTHKLIARIAMEMVSHAKMNESFTWLSSYLSSCFKRYLPSTLWFIEYLKRNNTLKEMILICPHEHIRIDFSDLLTTIFKILIDHKIVYISNSSNKLDIPDEAHKILIRNIIDLLEESRPHWKRFKQYFEVIQNYSLFGNEQRRYLIDLNILYLYQDYFMGSNKGKKERAPVMDDQYFPDLVEFYNLVSIILRSVRNESKDKNVLPPNRICDDLIEMPNGWLDFFWDKRFFQSFMEMDYNTPAVCEIVSYVSYKCKERSDMIMDILIDEFDECVSHKVHVFNDIFKSMILLNDDDDLVQHRIRNYIGTSHKKNNKGSLLRLAKSSSKNMRIVPYVLKLSSQSKALFNYLITSRDLYWIIDTYENLLEEEFNDFFVNDSIINEDIEKGYHEYFLKEEIPLEFNDKPLWKRSEDYLALLYSHYIAKQKPSSSLNTRTMIETNINDLLSLRNELDEIRERSLAAIDTFDHLKNQNRILKEILMYFKEEYGFDDTINKVIKKVEDEQVFENIEERFFNDDEEKEKGDLMNENNEEDQHKADLNEKLLNLKEFFGDQIEDEVLIEALSDNDFDINLAANALFNEDRVNYYRSSIAYMKSQK